MKDSQSTALPVIKLDLPSPMVAAKYQNKFESSIKYKSKLHFCGLRFKTCADSGEKFNTWWINSVRLDALFQLWNADGLSRISLSKVSFLEQALRRFKLFRFFAWLFFFSFIFLFLRVCVCECGIVLVNYTSLFFVSWSIGNLSPLIGKLQSSAVSWKTNAN